jgi:hypothetical protein
MLGALMQVDGAQAADPSETVAVEVAGITETAGGDELPLGLLGAGIGVSAADQVDTDPEDDITSTTVVDVPPTDVTAPPPTTISTPAAEVLPAAPTTVPVTTTTLPADRGEAALALMRFDWRTQFPDLRIEFLGPRNGLRALTYPAEHRIEIFVRDSDTPATLHRVLSHEMGHVIDVELNSPEERDRWLVERGIADSVVWWPSASAPDFATGAGDFAEAFAVWETGVQTQSTLAGQPDAGDLALLIELMS